MTRSSTAIMVMMPVPAIRPNSEKPRKSETVSRNSGTAVVRPETITDGPVEAKVAHSASFRGRLSSSYWKRFMRWIGFSTPAPKSTSSRKAVIVFRLPTSSGTTE